MRNRVGRFLVASAVVGSSLLGLPRSSFAQTGGSVIIDWVNFVQFHGIEYVDQCAPVVHCGELGRGLQANDLGPPFATVLSKLDTNVDDPGYQRKDGDAAYLDAGTSVHTVRGYRPTFRLAAYLDGEIHLYEADWNPRAKRGSDLVDIGGKVQYISINSIQDGTTEIAHITTRRVIRRMVESVLQGHVDQQRQDLVGETYFVEFHLKDGTVLERMYWLRSNALARGIFLRRAFRTGMERALKLHGRSTTIRAWTCIANRGNENPEKRTAQALYRLPAASRGHGRRSTADRRRQSADYSSAPLLLAAQEICAIVMQPAPARPPMLFVRSE